MKYLTLVVTLFTLAIGTLTAAESPTPEPTKMSWVNQKLQDSLADMITKATAVAGDAKDFVIQQMPDIIKQLLMWKFAESLLPMVFLGIVTLFMGWMVSRAIKAGDFTDTKEKSYDWIPSNGWPTAGFGLVKAVIGFLFFISFLMHLNLEWLQIWIAPKVYLIEYAKSMVGH
jgi:hypothetical protein